MDNLRPVLDAISQIHAAVLEPASWSAAVENVADLLRAEHAIVFAPGTADGGDAFAAVRVDTAHAARIHSAEAARLGSRMLSGIQLGLAFSSASVIPDRDMENSAFYNEIVRPANGFYSTSACLGAGGTLTALNFCRPRKKGPFDSAGIGTLQAILPHFANAIELSRRLAAARRQASDLQQLLDRVDSAVMLVDAAGQPCFANGRALRIVGQADGLMLGVSGLLAATAPATRRLRHAIAGIGRYDVAAAGSGAAQDLRLERPSRRPPLLLSLFPIWPLALSPAGTSAPRVAIFITEPDDRPPIDRDAIADAFRLTPREASVAALMAAGHDLKGVARILEIGIGTARYHLKNVLGKTNTSNQAMMVAGLRGFVRRRPE
jgi:DNA-binding CsgD family transcriptional regulator/PAS domain-containing protein